jgi:shikimate 5-dehydrogenase
MLLWQGVEALEIWLQQTLEDQVIDAMRRALGSS